jgi:hypothetical protein
MECPCFIKDQDKAEEKKQDKYPDPYMVALSSAVYIIAVCLSFRLVRNLSDGFKEGFPTRFTCGNDSLFCDLSSLWTDTI